MKLLGLLLTVGLLLALLFLLFILMRMWLIEWRAEDEAAIESQREDVVVAAVWPLAESSPLQLEMLAQILENWQATQPAVTEIQGLEDLLAGDLPPECSPIYRRYHPDPQLSLGGPVLILAENAEESPEDIITSLIKVVPIALGVVGEP